MSSVLSNAASPAPSLVDTARVAKACVGLCVFSMLLLAVLGTYAFGQYEWLGVQAAAVAVGVCWLGAILGLLITGMVRGPFFAVAGALSATMFRIVPAAIAGLILTNRGGPLLEAGVVEMLVISYLVTLLAETCLSVWLLQPLTRKAKVA